MKAWAQVVVSAAAIAVAVPLAARFVPATHPALAGIGLLAPLQAIGIVAEAAPGPEGGQGGPRGGFGGPVTVVAAPAGTQPLREDVTAIGSARGLQSVNVSPVIGGRVLRVHAAAGDRVEPGALLVELESETARLAVERARLVLADAQATAERVDRLSGSGTTTAIQKQDAALSLRTAELELQEAERDLQDHRITAPIGGIVGLIEVEEGDQVAPDTAITTIEDRSSLIVEFRVPERIAPRVTTGLPVEVQPLADAGMTLTGTVTAIDNRVDEDSRTLRLQARIDNAGDALRAGMSLRIALRFTGAEHPAVDPLAIQWGASGPFVWLVREGKAMRLPVTILQRHADAVLVRADLLFGDLVVTEGVQSLRPGAEVAPRAPDGAKS